LFGPMGHLPVACFQILLWGGEMVEGDCGYRGEPMKSRLPLECLLESDKRVKDCARARHETVNCRFKQWGCLHETYRHDLKDASFNFCPCCCCHHATPYQQGRNLVCLYVLSNIEWCDSME
jgi:hypothetical protein